MNNRNSWEEQLRSWVPRQPSARIEERLFGRPEARAAARPHIHFHWQGAWAAFAVASVVVLGTIANVSHLAASYNGGAAFSALSDQSYMASLSGVSAPHNTWSAPILGWTNSGKLPSTKRSFDVFNTNYLLR
jgi:hypothetical protein